jgi:hydroxyacylglutathione hydrolase
MVQVHPIRAFSDNYIWALTLRGKTWVVDPGQSAPVFEYLKKTSSSLAGILITHHHWDHTDGVASLLAQYPDITVFGPANSPFEGITHKLHENDSITIAEIEFNVITTPGHTLDHICYMNDALCFTGDTLFSAGCGRLFEGDPKMMWQSFDKFSEYDDKTKIYCTHEYTLSNLHFAMTVEPNNSDLATYFEQVQRLINLNLPSLPTSFGLERAINPFLRTSNQHILDNLPAHLHKTINHNWQVFSALRAWKDEF